MNFKIKPTILPWFSLAAGVIGLGLRIWLYGLVDASGLLPANHISSTLLCILTALVLGVLYLCSRCVSADGSYTDTFSASRLGSIGNLIAAIGIAAFCVKSLSEGAGMFARITMIAGLAACVCFALQAASRFKGRRVNFYLCCVYLVYFLLQTVSQCRTWGAQSQVATYGFQLLASVFLMLTAYHRCALSIDRGNYRWFLFISQAALFFCCLCLNTENSILYLSMTLWLSTDLCKFREI